MRVTYRARVRALLLLAAVTLIVGAGCGGGSDDAASSPTSAASAVSPGDATHPVGIVAMGHSALTGESSDPALVGAPARKNSWATGTAPEVNSIYARLVAVHPRTKGHVANLATGGAPASSLPSQAKAALERVPFPELVIIETIDSDIQCDGTDDAHLRRFSQSVSETLQYIVTRSPKSVVLMVGQPGRPRDDLDAIAAVPEAKEHQTGTGMCDLFDPAGERVDANVATLTSIIESYEAEQAKVCGTVPQCHTDGGAFAAFPHWFSDAVPDDWDHLTVHGLSRIAATAWPVVQQILGLP